MVFDNQLYNLFLLLYISKVGVGLGEIFEVELIGGKVFFLYFGVDPNDVYEVRLLQNQNYNNIIRNKIHVIYNKILFFCLNGHIRKIVTIVW